MQTPRGRALALAALMLTAAACKADVTVVDAVQDVPDGGFFSWKLEAGKYWVDATTRGDGASLEWVGAACPLVEAASALTATCELSGAGQVIVHNPAAVGRGEAASVTIKVVRLD